MIPPGRLTRRGMIPWGDSEKYKYLCKNETKIENVLTCWLVAQVSSNDEKNGGQNSRWTVPLILFFTAVGISIV